MVFEVSIHGVLIVPGTWFCSCSYWFSVLQQDIAPCSSCCSAENESSWEPCVTEVESHQL